MILPSKHLSVSRCLLTSGAKVLEELKAANTVSSIWEKVRNTQEISTFEKYVLTLSFLYSLNCIEYSNGLLKRCSK